MHTFKSLLCVGTELYLLGRVKPSMAREKEIKSTPKGSGFGRWQLKNITCAENILKLCVSCFSATKS